MPYLPVKELKLATRFSKPRVTIMMKVGFFTTDFVSNLTRYHKLLNENDTGLSS